jgi:hypothetical protein
MVAAADVQAAFTIVLKLRPAAQWRLLVLDVDGEQPEAPFTYD